MGTAPILGTSGIRSSEKSYLNTSITVRVCRFSVNPSFGTKVYFGMLLLVIFICILATITLYIPVLRQVSISVRRSTLKISNFERNKHENTSATEMKSTTLSKSENIEMTSMAINDASKIQLPKATQAEGVQTDVSHREKFNEKHPLHSEFPREQGGEESKRKSTRRGGKSKRETVQRRLTIMFFFLIVVYLISYIPPLVLMILTYGIKDFDLKVMSKTKTQICIFFSQMVLLNHVINPIIYGYYDTQFRKRLISCLKRRIRIL
jgi:hypothetical protein